METSALKNDLILLVSFLLTSARGLYDEPADYGTFRLIDSAGRLLQIMESHGMSDEFLNRLKQNIDEEREGNMDQSNRLDHLDQMILETVQQIQNL
ncbi:MAG: DUF6092 family protein [Flexilinea sp.]